MFVKALNTILKDIVDKISIHLIQFAFHKQIFLHSFAETF